MARVLIEDYPVLPWEEVCDSLEDVTEQEYEAAQNWFLADTDTINVEFFEKVSDVAKTNRYSYDLSGLKATLVEMWHFIMGEGKGVWIFIWFGILLLISILVSRLSILRKVESVFACIGGGVMLAYFTLTGRAPLRVWAAVFYAIFFTLIYQVSNFKIQKPISVLLLISMLMGIGHNIAFSQLNTPNLAVLAKAAKSDPVFEQTYEGDNLYVWNEWYDSVIPYFMKENKLPTEEFLDHNIAAGDWTYGHYYFMEHLKEIHAENPAYALIARPHTYLVAEDYTFVLQYLQEHYGTDIKVVESGEIINIPVWQFYR